MEIINKYIAFTKKEQWIDLPDFEGRYKISNFGNIINIRTNNILNPWLNTKGYRSVTLNKNGKPKSYKVHKLMAISFLNHLPNGMNEVVDHINGDKNDNSINNLRLVSQRENTHNSRKSNKYSKYIGVSFDKRYNNWIANIRINGSNKFIKSSKCELSCAYAYNMELKNLI
jgi:hypothetical protein